MLHLVLSLPLLELAAEKLVLTDKKKTVVAVGSVEHN